MSREASRTVSRRNLFRALLGRDIPAGHAQCAPESDRHAAGDAAYAAGDFPAAVAAYRASVRGDLSNPTARARLGCALYATGRHIQARVEFEHVLRLEGANLSLARMGLGSRRQIEDWIRQGRITVNGAVAQLGHQVSNLVPAARAQHGVHGGYLALEGRARPLDEAARGDEQLAGPLPGAQFAQCGD